MPDPLHRAVALLLLACACAHTESPPLNPLRQRLQGVVVDWDDPRVARAAEALRAEGDDLRTLQTLARQALAREGAPAMQLAVAVADDAAALAAEVERLAPARCAEVGAAPTLVLCYRALVDVDGVPTQLDLGTPLTLRGRMLGESRLREVLLMSPTGEVRSLDVVRDGRNFDAQAEGLAAGRHSIEIMVTTARGPEVAALWQLDVVGADAPAATSSETAPTVDRPDLADGDAEAAALRFFSGLKADRVDAGRPAVTWSGALARAATQRAERLAEEGLLRHADAALLESLADDRGQPISWLAENLARARSVAGARRAILESPSHRRNHLAVEAEHAGVGVVWRELSGERTLFLVVLLARSYADLAPHDLAAAVTREVNRGRGRRAAPPMTADPDLAARAQALAAKLPTDPLQLAQQAPDRRLTRELLQARPELLSAGAAVFRLDNPRGLEPTASLLAPRYNRVGVGAVRPAARKAWLVVVLVAEARPAEKTPDTDGFGGSVTD